jgi:hypothetical protein
MRGDHAAWRMAWYLISLGTGLVLAVLVLAALILS